MDNSLIFKPAYFQRAFFDDDDCLDWLKNKLYPDGINCPVCNKITRHHKLLKRSCYCCDTCGHQVYPTKGTIFYKSSIPLKTWFEIISKISSAKRRISIIEIQRQYHINYKTAWRMVKSIREFIQTQNSLNVNKDLTISSNKKHNDPLKSSTGIQVSEPPILSPPEIVRSSVVEAAVFPGKNEDRYARQFYSKRDRTARLLKLQMLLYQNPKGLEIKEISSRCSISNRTVYRDLRALEMEMNIPIWQNGNKRGIVEGHFLPPINFTVAEATTLYLAARLIQNYFTEYDPNISSLFVKLNTITPFPLKKNIQHILEYLAKQPRDIRKVKNFNILLNAWLSRHKVKLTTRAHMYEEPLERIINPYLIEPSAIGGSSYVIAYCNLKKKIYAFKIDRIVGDVVMLPETFEIPGDFDTIEYLNSAWGVQTDQKIQTVKLHFNPRISRSILEEEEKVHSSQVIENQPDGSIIMSIQVRDYIHIRNWIMKWGDEVEVIEPEILRNQIRDIAQSIANIYPKDK